MSPIPCYVCSYSFCIYAHNFCINSGKKKKGLGYVMCVCGERGSLKSKEIPPGREANETWKGIHAGDLIRNLVVSEMAQGERDRKKKALNAREIKGEGVGVLITLSLFFTTISLGERKGFFFFFFFVSLAHLGVLAV